MEVTKLVFNESFEKNVTNVYVVVSMDNDILATIPEEVLAEKLAVNVIAAIREERTI